MKHQAMVMMTLLCFLVLGSLNWTACKSNQAVVETVPAVDKPVETTPATPQEPRGEPTFITEIKDRIKGKENLPAEEVFENIQIMKGFPAGRILPIMQQAFNQSLGVKCNHCHEFGQWASEAKPKKQIARDMWLMTGQINKDLLGSIDNLESAQPVVNCTTCHRGDAIPKTSME